jgi:hypothetical protein
VEGGVKRASSAELGVTPQHINATFERMRAGKIDGRVVLTVSSRPRELLSAVQRQMEHHGAGCAPESEENGVLT